jgi:hypothetical protein
MKPTIIGLIALTLMSGLYAAGSDEEHNQTQTIYGAGIINAGQIVNGNSRYEPAIIQHRWLQSNAMVLGDSVTSGSRMTMKIELVGVVQFSSWVQNQNGLGYIDARLPSSGFYFNEASGTYVFGDPEKKLFSITTGFFPYKYNPDVKNLGEYLFRSMAYPNYIIAYFDQPFARMLGLKLSNRLLGGSLRQDLILSNEWQQYPTKDFSLAYVAGLNIGNFLDIGVGGQAFHLLSTRENYTTPDSVRTLLKWNDGQWYYASAEDSAADKKTPYTFKAIKLMGRININPLAAMDEIKLPVIGTLFGKEDLKVYAEANVFGLKNYPTHNPDAGSGRQWEFYNKLSERIPVTFGINAPTNPVVAYGIIPTAAFLFGKDEFMFSKQEQQQGVFWNGNTGNWDTGMVGVRVKDFTKRLFWSAGSVATTAAALFLQNKLGINVRPDVLSFEFEYWSNMYPNGWEDVYRLYIPAPEFNFSNITYQHNRWRWSVFTTKHMGNFFAKLQLAHDHMVAYQTQLNQVGTVDNLGVAGYWWWTLKTGYSF